MEARGGVIIERLLQEYPDSQCALEYGNNFQLLVAVVLSAQCTDERVNKVTRELFEVCKTPADLAQMSVESVEKIIRSVGLSKTKATNLVLTARKLVQEYGGQVPCEFEQLIGLYGVGEKTANVVLNIAFNKPAIAVDTHVKRVSNRLGFSGSTNPSIVAKDLFKVIPKPLHARLNLLLVNFGRNVCCARRPNCEKCVIENMCNYHQKNIKK